MGVVEGGGDHRLVLERLRVGSAHHPVVGDAEAVDQARDLEQVLPAQAARHEVVAAVADADDELGPDGVADGPQHLADEAAAVLEAPAVLVRALVGQGREEVLEEVAAVEGDVTAVVAALLEPHGGGGPGVDHLADLALRHDVRPLAVPLLAGVRGRPEGHPRVPGVPAAAAVRDLREAERAVAVDRLAHPLELGDDAVVPVVHLAPVVDRGGVDAGRAEHHHDAAAALGLLLVVADVAVGDPALLAERRAVGRGHDAVLRLAAPDLHRAEQPSELRGHVGLPSNAGDAQRRPRPFNHSCRNQPANHE